MKKKKRMIISVLIGASIFLSACTNTSKEQGKQQETDKAKPKFEIVQADNVNIDLIRGIGYPGNDNGLYVAAKNGLNLFKDKTWYQTTTNQHDYISFQAIAAGFVASGHPQKGIGLKDPLGIIQSSNNGKTFEKIAFYGQKIFHFMAASYNGNGLYVINEKTGNNLSPGVNFSTDGGESWKQSLFNGFNADSLGMIAVHSTNGDIVAMATRTGIFYSEDNGNTMKQLAGPIMVTALTFTGDSILFSSVENNQIQLKSIDSKTEQQTNLPFPFLDYDNPITYLAVNPKSPNQIAFSTYKNDLYETTDGGKSWSLLLKKGKEQD